MARDFFTMDDFDLSGRTVLLRVDINSPIDPGTGALLNDARIREHLTTIRELRHSKVALLAHQSRPGKDDFTTLEVHAERIGALLGRPVRYVSSLFGRPAIEAIEAMRPGDVVVLENTRFFSEEEALSDAKLEKMAKTHIVQRLAPHAEYFVLDAFAAAHRAQPSLVGFCEVLPSLAGRVMERELTMLSRAVQDPARPKIALLGGVKADDSIAVARHMLEQDLVDTVLTSGGVANLFLDAAGFDPGTPTTDFMRREISDYDAHRAMCKELLEKFRRRSADALRMDFERGEIIFSRSGLMREEGDFRMSQLADRRQVLPDPRVVQEGAGPGIDRGVDVDPQQDRPAREVEIVHREEVSGHRRRRYIPGRNSFFASGRTLATARNQSVFSNGETRLEPF